MTIKIGARAVLLTFATLMLMMAGLTLVATDADAQGPPPPAARYVEVPAGQACPTGTVNVGTVNNTPFPSRNGVTFCQPDGFVPITSQALCATSGGNWFGDASPGICAYSGWTAFTVVPSPATCEAPYVFGVGTAPGAISSEPWCLLQLLSGGSSGGLAGTPICIESEFAQTHAPDAQVGSRFDAAGGHYFIHYGPPTCQVNCHHGFDFNCDDKLGDYCPTEVNLRTVAGVQACQASFDAQAAAAAAAVEAAASVPAVEAAAPVSVAVGGGLAHTGADTTSLALIATSLLGIGVTVLGARRRVD